MEDRAELVPVTGRNLVNARKNKLLLGGFNVVGLNARPPKGVRVSINASGAIKSRGPKTKKGRQERVWHFEPVVWRTEKVAIKGAFTPEAIGARFARKAASIIKRAKPPARAAAGRQGKGKPVRKPGPNPRIYLKTKIAVMYRLGGFDDAEITRHEVERWVNNYVVQQGKFFDDNLEDTNWDWVQDALWGVAWHV